MKSQTTSSRKNVLPAATLIVAILLFNGVLGCAGSGAFFQRSYDVANQFEKGIILADHRYYEGGPVAKPNALAAIHSDYTLDSEHWREIRDLTPEGLAKLVTKIRFVSGAEYKERIFTNGARIVGPGGRVVGVWYSVYDYSLVRFLDGNRVYLSFPPARLPPNVPIFAREYSEREHY